MQLRNSLKENMSPNPEPPPELTSEGKAVIARLLGEIPADEATVWLYREAENVLLAIHNPVNPEIVGLTQPVSQGLISQVLVTGLPLLEPDVTTRHEHDRNIDSQTGQQTLALMAAPIDQDADVTGVVSAVQLSGGESDRGFNERDLATLEHATRELGKLMASARSAQL